MPLSVSEREEFFHQPHIAIISISKGEYSAPLSVPIWYYYIPREEFWIATEPTSLKGKALLKTNTLSLATQISRPLKYVTVEAEVTSSEKTTYQQAHAISARYISDPIAAQNFADSVMLSDKTLHTTFHLKPLKWFSADLGILD